MQICRPWDQPSVQEARVRLPARGAAAEEIPVLEAPGRFSNCDLYGIVPADWLTVELRLRARSGTIRALVARQLVSEAPAIEQPAGAGGSFTGILLSVRGRPCTGFELSALGLAGATTGEAYLRLECWGEDGGAPIDRASLTSSPARQQLVVAAQALVVGPNAGVIAANPNGGRVGLTSIALTCDDAANFRRCIVLAGATTIADYHVRGDAPVVAQALPLPLRSGRGETISITVEGPAYPGATNIRASLAGFYE